MKFIKNFKKYSQEGAWERGRSQVGRDILFPTLTQTIKQFKYLFVTLHINYKYRLFNLCQLLSGRGHPDLWKYYNLTYLSQKLFFNVKTTKNIERYL